MDYQKEQTFGVGPDLDLNTSDMSWNTPVESTHTPRSIGNKVINFPVENQNQLSQTSETEMPHNPAPETLKPLTPETQKLGQIISLEPAEKSQNPTPPALDHSVIQAKGDHISKESVAEIKKLESKLDKDGDAANFYDNIREINGVYAKNAFGRHLYDDKPEGKAA